MICLKTPDKSQGHVQSHKSVRVKRTIYRTTFLSGVFHTCYLCFKKRNGIRQNKQCSCSKRPFYYLTANKTRDVFQNSGPLASLRLKSTWGAVLISVDLLKITLLHISFYIFIIGLCMGVAYIRNHYCVSILMVL